MAIVFISHSSQDKDFARTLATNLKDAGHEPWLDEWQIKVGECIVSGVEKGIETADYVVIVMSPHSCSSNWVEKEWKTKVWDEIQQNKTMVLPILLAECDIPPLLKTKKYADFRKNHTVGFMELMAAIQPFIAPNPPVQLSQAADHSEEISALLTKVQASQAPLSACISEGLALARKLKNSDLEAFCRRELAGYKEGDELQPFRFIERFVSGDFINMQYGWANSRDILSVIRNSPQKFVPKKHYVWDSITHVEEQCRNTPDPSTAIVHIQATLKDINPNATRDAPVWIYGPADFFCHVLSRVRQEFTLRLLNALPNTTGK